MTTRTICIGGHELGPGGRADPAVKPGDVPPEAEQGRGFPPPQDVLVGLLAGWRSDVPESGGAPPQSKT